MPDKPPYNPVPDLAELCAVGAQRLMSSAGGALRMRAALLRLRDGLDVGPDDSRDAVQWRLAIERWLGRGMPGTPTGDALAARTEQLAIADRQQRELREKGTEQLMQLREQVATAQQQVLDLNGLNEQLGRELEYTAGRIVELAGENARLKAELDTHAGAKVNIIPGDKAMLDRVLAPSGHAPAGGAGWHPEEGEVVRAAADGYQVTWRGGAWVPE